ncbi:MAG: LysM peptidoglycan-binding domain-containing protein [Polyangiaceae bacterium]
MLTGTKHFATVQSIEDALQWPGAARQFSPTWPGLMVNVLRNMGADVEEVSQALEGQPVEQTLTGLLEANPDSVAQFSVTWVSEGVGTAANEFSGTQARRWLGHTMVAYQNPITGVLQIMDRTGNIVGSVAELDGVYPGIRNAQFYGDLSSQVFYSGKSAVLIMRGTSVVPALQTGQSLAVLAQSATTPFRSPDGTLWTDASWVHQGVGLEIRSIPFRVEPRRVTNVPLRVTRIKPNIRTQTICTSRIFNSDTPPDQRGPTCHEARFYQVKSGDTMADIATAAYGDPNRWRGIAAVNGIDDPAKLMPGRVFVIP